MIAKLHIETVCKVGQGPKCCSYLVLGAGGFGCAKDTSIRKVIEARRNAGTIVAMGDNCDGWTVVKESN
jgi:hypothetical protein